MQLFLQMQREEMNPDKFTLVLVWEHLQTADLFMNSSFQVVASLMSLW
jgi:hypothetical protein